MSWLSDRVNEVAAEALVPMAAPEVPTMWGSDLSCEEDIDPGFVELPGNDPRLVAQSAFRAITTPRGSVPDAPDYGIDIRGYLHSGLTRQRLQQIDGIVALEIAKDDRIASVNVVSEQEDTDDGPKLRIRIDGVIAGSTGTFSLVVGLTDSGALLEEMASR